MTNKHNSKMYIGYTTELLKRRINTLFQASKKMTNASISVAIRKYGISGFTFSVLWKGNSRTEMLEMKKFYISFYDSMLFGYNCKTGGIMEKYSPYWINILKGIPRTEVIKKKLRTIGKTNYKLYPEKFIAFKIKQKEGNIEILNKWHKAHPNALKGKNNPNYKHGRYCK